MNTASNPSLPRKVLVALDVGSLSDPAVARAYDLAQRFDAHIELVHAFASPIDSWGYSPPPAQVASGTDQLERVRQHLVRHVDALRPRGGAGPRADEIVRVIPGRPARVLLRRARETSSDLIVLGALRRRPAIDFGSTARAILAKSGCPVWVQPTAPTKVERILVPYDASSESRRALGLACPMARAFGASVHVVQVFDVGRYAAMAVDGYSMLVDVDAIREQTQREFESDMQRVAWGGVQQESSFVDGVPAEEILARSRAGDLIVMGTHGRTGLAAAILGSVAYEVLRRTECPVLAVRDADRSFEL